MRDLAGGERLRGDHPWPFDASGWWTKVETSSTISIWKRYTTILPNTAGCFSAEDAIRHARLARELLANLGNPGAEWVKLECLGDTKTLLPDPVATLKATGAELVKEGLTVLVYTSDDPIMAKHLKNAGAASVMPAGSPRSVRARVVLNPEQLAHHPGISQGRRSGLSGDRRCRRGHGQRRDGGDGTGLRRRAAEHGHRAGVGPAAHGVGDAARCVLVGAAGVSVGEDNAQVLYATASSPWEGRISPAAP